jgi:VIT1/CCC1 family predicted Fe2+/Mn2+ transporter
VPGSGAQSHSRAVARMVAGGTLAMAVTFGIGHLVAVGI